MVFGLIHTNGSLWDMVTPSGETPTSSGNGKVNDSPENHQGEDKMSVLRATSRDDVEVDANQPRFGFGFKMYKKSLAEAEERDDVNDNDGNMDNTELDNYDLATIKLTRSQVSFDETRNQVFAVPSRDQVVEDYLDERKQMRLHKWQELHEKLKNDMAKEEREETAQEDNNDEVPKRVKMVADQEFLKAIQVAMKTNRNAAGKSGNESEIAKELTAGNSAKITQNTKPKMNAMKANPDAFSRELNQAITKQAALQKAKEAKAFNSEPVTVKSQMERLQKEAYRVDVVELQEMSPVKNIRTVQKTSEKNSNQESNAKSSITAKKHMETDSKEQKFKREKAAVKDEVENKNETITEIETVTRDDTNVVMKGSVVHDDMTKKETEQVTVTERRAPENETKKENKKAEQTNPSALTVLDQPESTITTSDNETKNMEGNKKGSSPSTPNNLIFQAKNVEQDESVKKKVVKKSPKTEETKKKDERTQLLSKIDSQKEQPTNEVIGFTAVKERIKKFENKDVLKPDSSVKEGENKRNDAPVQQVNAKVESRGVKNGNLVKSNDSSGNNEGCPSTSEASSKKTCDTTKSKQQDEIHLEKVGSTKSPVKSSPEMASETGFDKDSTAEKVETLPAPISADHSDEPDEEMSFADSISEAFTIGLMTILNKDTQEMLKQAKELKRRKKAADRAKKEREEQERQKELEKEQKMKEVMEIKKREAEQMMATARAECEDDVLSRDLFSLDSVAESFFDGAIEQVYTGMAIDYKVARGERIEPPRSPGKSESVSSPKSTRKTVSSKSHDNKNLDHVTEANITTSSKIHVDKGADNIAEARASPRSPHKKEKKGIRKFFRVFRR